MSEENVEVVRSSFTAWNRGDVDAFLALYHPDAEWDMTRYSGWPGDRTYRGSDSLKSYFKDIFTVFEGLEVKAERLVELGSDQILAYARVAARGKQSGAPVAGEAFWQICTVRDGKILRVRNYTDRAEALKEAGLQE